MPEGIRGQCVAALPTPVNWHLPCVYPHNTNFSGHVTSGTRPYKFSRAWGRGYPSSTCTYVYTPTLLLKMAFKTPAISPITYMYKSHANINLLSKIGKSAIPNIYHNGMKVVTPMITNQNILDHHWSRARALQRKENGYSTLSKCLRTSSCSRAKSLPNNNWISTYRASTVC